MGSESGHRFAIYYTSPRNGALTQFANSWLQRDAWTGDDIEASAASADWISAPRQYGWHATLKAPFRLRTGASKDQLLDALTGFAKTNAAFTAPPLKLTRLGSFLALTLSEQSTGMDLLAANCVRCFDTFRQPMSQEESVRRRQGLTDAQSEMLDRWGYPYVFDQYRFHMTLTGSLDQDELVSAENVLLPRVTEFCTNPFPVQSIFLFEQTGRQHPFVLTAEFPLGDSR